MTRSWVWLVRGELTKAFTYNAAGSLLLIWIAAGGVLGGVRLLTGNHELMKVPFHWLQRGMVFWLVGPYLGLWVVRLLGFNPL